VDVKKTVDLLKRLQNAEIAVRSLDTQISRTPGRIQSIEASLNGSREALAAVEAELEVVRRERRQHEQAIEEIKAKVSRHQEQLMAVKTNVEYRALNKEIANELAGIDKREEQILVGMEQADDLEKAISSGQSELKAEEARVATETATLQAEQVDLEKQRGQQQDEIARVTEEVAPPALQTYRRVSELRGGIALARLNGDGCGECRVRIRPQNVEELRSAVRLVQCELCNRILILPSEVEAEVEADA